MAARFVYDRQFVVREQLVLKEIKLRSRNLNCLIGRIDDCLSATKLVWIKWGAAKLKVIHIKSPRAKANVPECFQAAHATLNSAIVDSSELDFRVKVFGGLVFKIESNSSVLDDSLIVKHVYKRPIV